MNIIGKIIIAPVKSLVEELAGSLSLPKRWEGKAINEIIQDAKAEHFSKMISRNEFGMILRYRKHLELQVEDVLEEGMDCDKYLKKNSYNNS